MQVKRSGEAVRGAVLTGGLTATAIAPLITPWVTLWLDTKAARWGVTLPDGYHGQFITALTSLILYVAAAIKVGLLGLEDGFVAYVRQRFASGSREVTTISVVKAPEAPATPETV